MGANLVFQIRRHWRFLLTAVAIVCYPLTANSDITFLEVQHGKITMEASRVSLIEVAKAISEKSNIPITASEGLDQMVDISVFEMALIPAIARISPNHLVVQKKINGKNVITSIQFILDSGSSIGGEYNLPSGEPAEEIAEQQIPKSESLEPLPSDQHDASSNGNDGVDPSDQTQSQ